MKRFLRILGWTLAVGLGVAALGHTLAAWLANSRYNRQWTAHEVTFPVPFPLTDTEVAALREERAVARGQLLIDTRLGCSGCHGRDLSRQVLVDDPMVGHWVAPNLTPARVASP